MSARRGEDKLGQVRALVSEEGKVMGSRIFEYAAEEVS
jgi:hypothetical protein